MSKYKLIAFDMDGTLLNSEKRISERTLEAVNRAFDAGKEVILSTGRCVAELREYFKRIPGLRYVVCSSGAILYDVKEEKILYSNSISIELAEKILAESKKRRSNGASACNRIHSAEKGHTPDGTLWDGRLSANV